MKIVLATVHVKVTLDALVPWRDRHGRCETKKHIMDNWLVVLRMCSLPCWNDTQIDSCIENGKANHQSV